MTVAEAKFMEMVPSQLREIAKQLDTLNNNIVSLANTLVMNNQNKTENETKKEKERRMEKKNRKEKEKKIDKELARKDYLIKETVVMLTADLYQTIYDYEGCWTDAAETIIELAEEFENRLQWNPDGDDRDFIDELEKFKKEILKRYSD